MALAPRSVLGNHSSLQDRRQLPGNVASPCPCAARGLSFGSRPESCSRLGDEELCAPGELGLPSPRGHGCSCATSLPTAMLRSPPAFCPLGHGAVESTQKWEYTPDLPIPPIPTQSSPLYHLISDYQTMIVSKTCPIGCMHCLYMSILCVWDK